MYQYKFNEQIQNLSQTELDKHLYVFEKDYEPQPIHSIDFNGEDVLLQTSESQKPITLEQLIDYINELETDIDGDSFDSIMIQNYEGTEHTALQSIDFDISDRIDFDINY
jgi:hypothetical protein